MNGKQLHLIECYESNKVYFLELDDWIYLLKKDFIVTINLFMKTIFPNQIVKGKFFTLNKFIEESQVLVDKIDIQPTNDFDDSIIHRFISKTTGLFRYFSLTKAFKLSQKI